MCPQLLAVLQGRPGSCCRVAGSLSCLSPELSSSGSSVWPSSGLCFCLLVISLPFFLCGSAVEVCGLAPCALGHLSSQASLSLSSAFPVHLGPFCVRWLFFLLCFQPLPPIFLAVCSPLIDEVFVPILATVTVLVVCSVQGEGLPAAGEPGAAAPCPVTCLSVRGMGPPKGRWSWNRAWQPAPDFLITS